MNPVRVVLCTSGGQPGALVLDRLLASHRIEVVGVIQSTRVLSPRYGPWRGAWEHYRRSGLAYTLYLGCLTWIADALADGKAVRQVVGSKRLPIHATRNVNDAASRAFLQQVQPELLVSAFFNQRIHARTAAIPRSGAINIHPSLLPGFKGVDPVFFVRLRGAHELGVSLHRIAPQLDCGDILVQEACPEQPEESTLRTTVRLFGRGADLLVDNLGELVGGAHPRPQGSAGGYDSWPDRAQVAALRRQGQHLVHLRDLLDLSRGRLAM